MKRRVGNHFYPTLNAQHDDVQTNDVIVLQTPSRECIPGVAVVVILALVSGFTSCKPKSTQPAKRYEFKGKVVSVDRDLRQATISHDDIPGFMPAMTMPFNIKEKWAIDVISEGNTVKATLVADDSGTWLEDVVIVQDAPDGPGIPEGSASPKPGDEVPNFALLNQHGRRIELHDYRGRWLLVTFIYTRCPLPDYCPLMSRNFAIIEESLRSDAALYASTHLLSITIDPEYDKPAVLLAYAENYVEKDRFNHWELATGTPKQVKAAAEYFGLRYWTEKDQIVHSLTATLIGPDGKVVKSYTGNEWTPDEVLSELKSANGLAQRLRLSRNVRAAS